jgi:hypothetical protein
MKKYVKKKSKKAGPNASGPKYRTPDHLSPPSRFGKAGSQPSQSVSKFSGPKAKPQQVKFAPPFKVQHKG